MLHQILTLTVKCITPHILYSQGSGIVTKMRGVDISFVLRASINDYFYPSVE